MKNILVIFLLAISVALGGLCVVQQHKLRARSQILEAQAAEIESAQARGDALEKELKEKSEKIENAALAEQKAAVLQKAVTESSAAAIEKSEQVEKLQQTLDDAKTNNLGSMISGLLKDPKMKEMIKNQQKLYIGPMVDKSYSALFQKLNLTPDQSATLKDLLEKKMMVGADVGTSMLDSSLDAAKRKELTNQIKTETEAFDTQIKEFLGSENYQAFQSYEKTVPDRMTLGQFNDQLTAGGTPMTSIQQDQLIQAMNEERSGFKWTVDLSQQNSAAKDLSSAFTEDNINRYVQEKERFDQQFLQRAQNILAPDQMKAFQDFQKGQLIMQKTSMQMAAKMFGGSGK
jgi:hypothetical protein